MQRGTTRSPGFAEVDDLHSCVDTGTQSLRMLLGTEVYVSWSLLYAKHVGNQLINRYHSLMLTAVVKLSEGEDLSRPLH